MLSLAISVVANVVQIFIHTRLYIELVKTVAAANANNSKNPYSVPDGDLWILGISGFLAGFLLAVAVNMLFRRNRAE